MARRTVVTRREALVRGGGALAGMAFMNGPLSAAELWPALGPQEEVIPWLDQPPPPGNPDVNVLEWEKLDTWITPTDQHFRVGHYGTPEIAEADWHLQVKGLVRRPLTFTLDDLKRRPRQEVDFTVECAGNRGFSSFIGAVYNARFTGTPLAPILEEAGLLEDGIEIVFFGADTGTEEIRGNEVEAHFGRSMSVEDAMDPNIILCYEVNGEPLTTPHGFPLRVIAPGWYGVANVKWLERIEVWDKRYMGRFMARDYVTLREEDRDGEMVYTESSVGRARINSTPAKVTHDDGRYRIFGVAWGASIARVEIQIDDGPWQSATLTEGQDSPFTWVFWHVDWAAAPGEHTISSRAVDRDGNVQPRDDDPLLSGKLTYWESNGQMVRSIRIA